MILHSRWHPWYYRIRAGPETAHGPSALMLLSRPVQIPAIDAIMEATPTFYIRCCVHSTNLPCQQLLVIERLVQPQTLPPIVEQPSSRLRYCFRLKKAFLTQFDEVKSIRQNVRLKNNSESNISHDVLVSFFLSITYITCICGGSHLRSSIHRLVSFFLSSLKFAVPKKTTPSGATSMTIKNVSAVSGAPAYHILQHLCIICTANSDLKPMRFGEISLKAPPLPKLWWTGKQLLNHCGSLPLPVKQQQICKCNHSNTADEY